MAHNSKVSIVTIVYNDVKGIRKTIESVLNQKTSADEYIIIDGGSRDGTYEIINEYRGMLTKFISEPDSGIYDAMNKGWRLCKDSNYILFCNSSDHLESEAVSSFTAHLKLDHDASDIYHGMLKFVKGDSLQYIQGRTSEILLNSMIEHPASFVHKKVFDTLSGFNLKYKSASDYDFMIRAKLAGFKFSFIQSIISNFDTTGISSTSSKGVLESLKIKMDHGLMSKSEYLLRTSSIKLAQLAKRAIK
ncbi:putative glycosyltransferase [compost metagenome]